MRLHGLMAATIALTGCGAKSSLAVGTGDAGGLAPQTAHILPTCAPNDGLAIQLSIGWPTCDTGTQPSIGVAFLVSNADLAGLQAGSMLTVVNDINAGTQGVVVSGGVTSAITGGTLDFATYVPDTSATGSYDVTYGAGSLSGTFTADGCPGNRPCGG